MTHLSGLFNQENNVFLYNRSGAVKNVPKKEIECSCLDILGMRVDLVQIPDVISFMVKWIENREKGSYIVISNANDAVTSKKDEITRRAVNSSNLSVPDGISLVLLARIVERSVKKRVYGPDLMLEFLKMAEARGYTNFLYGTTQPTLERLTSNLIAKFPKLKIAGRYAPPFKPLSREEDERVVEMINKAAPDALWVGLGTPKQQIWMFEHRDKLNVPVMVGVGAAFDFLSGTKLQAPRWIREHGFEWLFRLMTEPKRLWRRYLVNGSLFIYYMGKELILKRFCLMKYSHRV